MALGCLLLLAASCHQGLDAPFVQLTLVNLPQSTVKLDVDVTLGAVMKMPTSEFSGTASSLATVTISFPQDARGLLYIAARALDATPCIVGTGTVAVQLDANQVYPSTLVAMAPTTGCQNPNTMNTLTVAKAGDGKGSISSADGSIQCGASCSGMFSAGTSVTLTATPGAAPAGATYQFVSWTGAGLNCPTATCQFQMNGALTATATFRCTGLCPEPSGQTNDLFGVWGFSTTRIIAVGDLGTILQNSGSAWTKVSSSPVTSALRAVRSSPGSMVGLAVGDKGVIIRTNDSGASWSTPLTSSTTATLRGLYVVDDMNSYVVGDLGMGSSFLYYLKSTNNNAWMANAPMGGPMNNWYAIAPVDATNVFLVGPNLAGRLFNRMTDAPSNTSIMAQNQTPGILYGAWAFSPTNLIAVGEQGNVLTSDGATWQTKTKPTGTPTFRGVYAFSPTSVYAVGDGGKIWKYDGTGWADFAAGNTTANLSAIWGSSESNFYVVGSGGTILHQRP
jgi:photosystem II stability/assembly factor-like uncharacterized protein